MKQSLQLKLGQQLTMTPQLQQAIRLLQLSTLDLQQEIQQALESNPMLEVDEEDFAGDNAADNDADNPGNDDGESGSANDAATEHEIRDRADQDPSDGDYSSADSDYQSSGDIPDDLPVDTSWDDVYQSTAPSTALATPDYDDSDFQSRRAATESLQDHLLWQLNLATMSDTDRVIGMAIIDAVEPSGMLAMSIEDIHAGLVPDLDVELDEVVAVQHRIQQFDPVGVAASDLRECLLIQLNQLQEDTPALAAARLIVDQYLTLLGNRDYKTLMRRAKLKEPELKAAVRLIQSLNPYPGDAVASDDTAYVVPDVFVHKQGDRWRVELNPDIAPKLRINGDYAALVKRADTSADNTFLRENLQEARWFLKSLQSRNETLLKVATCIVEYQREFLERGEEAMKPLVLHDVAETVGMHESTISRVTTQKFMHTPQGIFELKYFFSSHVSTDSGGECSSTAIRAMIKKLVAGEDSRKPLSDSKITQLLEDQGIQVARRTIAKYRESLNIPPSNERKRLV